jgi:fumarate reductase flavoprotein subunit
LGNFNLDFRGKDDGTIMDDLTCGVLIVGAGLAGFTAALRAAESGAAVLLIDKSDKPLGDGNVLMASGGLCAGGMSPKSDPRELYRFVMSEGIGNPDLVHAWSNTCGRAVEWLAHAGVGVVETAPGQLWLDQESEISFAPVYKKDVGARALGRLKERLLLLGGEFLSGVEGLKLLVDDQRVHGLLARKSGTNLNLRSRATIVCTGGFSANLEMVKRYVGASADQCKLRGSPQCTGDGLRMGLEVGAKAVNLQYFYGHLVARKALTDDRFWPHPRLDRFVDDGILIDGSGSRFVDEGRGDVALANELARSADVTGATLVFDHTSWSASRDQPSSSSRAIPPPNPWLWQNDGEIFCADTVPGLADLLGIDAERFCVTVADYNRAVAVHNTSALVVIRTGNPKRLQAPFYGLRVVPGITFTMGGLAVNGRCEVLNLYERSFPGLYAAGDAIGGLMGGYKGGYTGGLMQAIVTGLLAGENAAQQ